jgi:hypothetical protein
MPYSSVAGAKDAGFPTSAEDIELTLAQINHLAEIYDAIKKQGTADNPMAVAWATWKSQYKKEGDKWVKKEEKKAIDRKGFYYFDEVPEIVEEGVLSEIQILRMGKWTHPEYGTFNIDEQDLKLFKENFDKKIRRVELAVDTEHFPEKVQQVGLRHWLIRVRMDYLL